MKFSACDWRFIARIVSIIHIPFSVILSINMIVAILLLYDVIDTKKMVGDELHEFFDEAKNLTIGYLVVSLLLHLAEIPVAVVLYLATNEERVVKLKKKCLIGVLIWLSFTILSLILTFVDAHYEDLQYAFAAIYILMIAFVVPFLILFFKKSTQSDDVPEVEEERDVNNNPSEAQATMSGGELEGPSAVPSTI